MKYKILIIGSSNLKSIGRSKRRLTLNDVIDLRRYELDEADLIVASDSQGKLVILKSRYTSTDLPADKVIKSYYTAMAESRSPQEVLIDLGLVNESNLKRDIL